MELTNVISGHKEHLPIDEVIVNHGYERDTSLLDNSAISVDRIDDYFISCNEKGESSFPGLFEAGYFMMNEGNFI